MKRDLLVLSGGMLAIGIATWVVWGNPVNIPRMHSSRSFISGPNLN
jgi:hypothetical protein